MNEQLPKECCCQFYHLDPRKCPCTVHCSPPPQQETREEKLQRGAETFARDYIGVMEELAEEEAGWEERFDREFGHSVTCVAQRYKDEKRQSCYCFIAPLKTFIFKSRQQAYEEGVAAERERMIEILDIHIEQAQKSYRTAVNDQVAPYRHQLERLLDIKAALTPIKEIRE